MVERRILAGNTFYFVLSATGLGALLLASYDVFFAIKWIGAAYLVWLGVSAFFGRSATLSVPVDGAPDRRGLRTLADGVLLQVANPKALVFFTALLPQFIDPATSVALQVATWPSPASSSSSSCSPAPACLRAGSPEGPSSRASRRSPTALPARCW